MRMVTLMAIAVVGVSGAALAQVGTTPTEQKGQMTDPGQTMNPSTTADPTTNPTTSNPGMNPTATPDTMTPDDMNPSTTTSSDNAMDNMSTGPDQVGNSY